MSTSKDIDGLAGVHARIDWAEEHVRTLDNALGTWRHRNGDPVIGQSNPAKTRHDFFASFTVPPDFIRWGILFGGAVHELRASLDNLAWFCASLYGNPPDDTEFPIFSSGPKYRKGGRERRLKGIDSDAIKAVIDRVQPFERPEGPDNDPLWAIYELDRKHKHRVITPVAVMPKEWNTSAVIEYRSEEEAADSLPPAFEAWDGPIEDGRRVLTVFTPTPPVKVRMKHDFTVQISIHHAGINRPVVQGLRELCQYTRWIVKEVADAIP